MKRGMKFLKGKITKNAVLMTITKIAFVAFLIGAASVDSSGTAAYTLMAISGGWCLLFYYVNNEWIER